MKLLLVSLLVALSLACSANAAAIELRNGWSVAASLKFLIDSGSRLKKGDVIAVRDPVPLITEVNRLNALLEQLRNEELSLRTQLEEAKAFGKDGNPAQRSNLEQAQTALDRYLTGEALLTRLTLQQAAADATTAFGNQTIRFNARDKMLQEGFIQKTEYDMEEARFNASKLAKETALARLDKFEKIEKPKVLQDLQKKVDTEKVALEHAVAHSQALQQQLPSKIDQQCKRISAVRGVLAQNLRYLAEVSILAPGDGVFDVRPSDHFPPLRVDSVLGPNELLGTLTTKP